jgi:hypothetical protein
MTQSSLDQYIMLGCKGNTISILSSVIEAAKRGAVRRADSPSATLPLRGGSM